MQRLRANLEKATLAALIYGNKLEGAGVLAEVVKNHESYFAASGIDIAAFDKSAKDVTGKKLLRESRRDFDGIIEVIKDSLKKNVSKRFDFGRQYRRKLRQFLKGKLVRQQFGRLGSTCNKTKHRKD